VFSKFLVQSYVSKLNLSEAEDKAHGQIYKTSTFIFMLSLFSYLYYLYFIFMYMFNPLNPKLNPICYLLVLLGAHHFLHVSRIRVKLLTFRRLMSYIYIWSTHS